MSNQTKKMTQGDLRQRAQSRMGGQRQASKVGASAAAALGVLHKLASSPDTAEHALALLHELQVHQIEIDMQADELRTLLTGAESALDRQIQYHDHMPVACLNIDASARVLEINQTGARWFGLDRASLLGQTIHAFLAPESKAQLLAHMAATDNQGESSPWEMTLLTDKRGAHTVEAALSADPSGGRYILVLMGKPAGMAN